MIRGSSQYIKAALPYILLAGAIGLSAMTFLRSEQYRAESDRMFGQTYEVQWRTTQIREYLTRLDGNLRLAAVTQHIDSDIGRNITLLSANVTQLLRLDYVDRFLGERDTDLLETVEKDLKLRVCPLVDGGNDYESALVAVADSKQKMFQISGTAVAHMSALEEAAHIASRASRNRMLFVSTLAISALAYAMLHMRYAYLRRRDQHQQSFAALYAHMTRSPVVSLRLFMSYLDASQLQDPNMLTDARKAVTQLALVTDGMNALAYAGADTKRAALSSVFDLIEPNKSKLVIDVSPEARMTIVPCAALRVILTELVKNAETAFADRSDGLIRIKATVGRSGLFRTPTLLIEVCDNGPGMSAEVAKKAFQPLFTTRAGSSAGLGLSACAQLVHALKGKITMASPREDGVLVQLWLPIPRFPAGNF